MRSRHLILALVSASLIGLWGAGCRFFPRPQQSDQVSTAEIPEGSNPDQDLSMLRLLYSRRPVTLNPHLATGYQDFEAARIVYEPLASYDQDGVLIPFLAADIPTVANGGVAADGRSVTWRLRQDVQWSDGKPFTAADVVFTYEFINNPVVAAATAQNYEAIETVETVDDHTVKITFKRVNPAWSIPFTGQSGLILPRHIFEEFNGANARSAPANIQPIGVGPYKVIEFTSGKVVFGPNDQYWDTAPAFKRVELWSGIAPYAAARSVLKTGEADFAHNLQVEASTLKELETAGQGKILTTFGSFVERIMLNPTDPNKATEEGERSSLEFPHPFLSDRTVRQAMNLAIDRDAIAQDLYGFTGRPTAQLLVAPAIYTSQNIAYEYNLEKAAALLENAGWRDTNNNSVRDKGGVEMQMLFQTSVNPVRQRTQEMVRDSLGAIGVAVEIKRVRGDDFFSSNPQQTQSINHFYADLQAYNTGNESPDPATYMHWWTCGEIAALSNNWQKPNNARYCNPEYDRLWETASQELDSQKRAQLFQQMDEQLAQDVAVIPIVHRAIANAMINSLAGANPTPWDASTWDIKNWRRTESP
ncbi:MAG: peptide ABC transporter substrate-binding protein [Leptolyngbyaceae cyanobacterium MO_188.B28]|nr:peptide ABC transporter substrate-binding protein [Leptolyngbyaceae cyanobacterium MO_188.B28]